jgi:purine-binding chemotaxis protein CheW
LPVHADLAASSSRPVTLVLLELDGRRLALPITTVVEVLRMVALTPLPEAPEWVAGMVNVRGDAMPVIDLRTRLSRPPRDYGVDTPLIVVTALGRRMAVVADAAVGVRDVPATDLDDPDELLGADIPITHLARIDGRVVPILMLDRICDGAQNLTLPDDDPGPA